MKSLTATITLPLLMAPEAEFIQQTIRTLHEKLSFAFRTDIGAKLALAELQYRGDEVVTEADRVALVLLRQQIERDLAALLSETQQARTENRAPVSPFK